LGPVILPFQATVRLKMVSHRLTSVVVHTTLIKANVLPQDPYFGLNDTTFALRDV
jgi:hypothetical protein